MKSNMLTKIQKVVTEPIYMTSDGELLGVRFVDKLTLKDKKWMRRRYVVNPGEQCSCLGYMKVGSCKHLKMVSGEIEGTGISAELCSTQLDLWQNVFSDEDFLKVNPDDLPATVRQVVFTVPDPDGKFSRMLFTQKFPTGSVVFIFNLVKEETS